MDLQELQKTQTDFSESRGWNYHKSETKEEFVDNIEYLAVAIAGEVGEFANLVKKVLRQKERLNDEMRARMKEETVDVFVYCLLISKLLDMDLEQEFLKKLEKNKTRFPVKD